MSKMSLERMRDAEDYELQPSSGETQSQPLLPSYDSAPGSSRQWSTKQKRRGDAKRIVRTICLTLLVALPSIALVGCWFGKDTVNRVKTWDQLPEDWKTWLGTLMPDDRIQENGGEGGDFPTNIGYAGPTPTGKEAGLYKTAPSVPMHTGVNPLAPPSSQKGKFNIMQHWGNLSPYYSVDSHGLDDSNSLIPHGCELEELHWLQRHGARYPTTQMDGPAGIAARLSGVKGWKAKDSLSFLNDWSFKLGAEVLTPFGRQQLFDLGVSARVKYGYLLDKMPGRLPVFRTESQDRMLKSAQNFAAGFFGYPAEEQYNLEVMIEAPGFNCTLAPWNTCHITYNDTYGKAFSEMRKWDEVFLRDAQKRLDGMMEGFDVDIKDVKDFMEMCAYETVALGYSSFCDLFTKDEWKGFEYRNDIFWWYTAGFGFPYAQAQGKGYAQELLSRLTHTRLTTFDSTTNSSFHDDVHFPLNDKLYVDFTHDTQFALLLPTLNLTSFAETGAPPTDSIPKRRSFIASKFCPFATNLQFQVLSCPSHSDRQIRLILNDAPVPLTGINGCREDKDGMCDLPSFIDGLRSLTESVDFDAKCGPKAAEESEMAQGGGVADKAGSVVGEEGADGAEVDGEDGF